MRQFFKKHVQVPTNEEPLEIGQVSPVGDFQKPPHSTVRPDFQPTAIYDKEAEHRQRRAQKVEAEHTGDK